LNDISVKRVLDRQNIITLIILIIIGIIYFLSGITHEGLWIDEAFTATVVKLPLSEIWKTIGSHDTHPPLYYLLLRLHVSIFGHSDFTLRLFSVFGALALALLGIGPIRRACGDKTGISYVFMVLVTPITLVYAQEARMYTWAAFFVTGCVSYAYLAATQEKRNDWLKLGIFTIAAAYTHYYALLATVISYILLLVWLLFNKKKQLSIYLLTAGIVILCYIPWIMNLLRQTLDVVHDFWIPNVTVTTLLDTLLYPYSYQFLTPNRPLYSNIAYCIFILLALFGIFRSLINKKKDALLAIFSLSVFIGTIVSGAIASYAIRPILVPRFMMPALGLFLLPVAYGLSHISKRVLLVSICSIIIGFSMPQIIQINKQQFKDPMKEVSSFLNGHMEPDDTFLHTNVLTAITFSYYFPGHMHFLYASQDPDNHQHHIFPNIIAGPDVNRFLNEHKKVWLIGRSKSQENTINNYWVTSGQLRVVDGLRRFAPPFSWFDIELIQVITPYPDGTFRLSRPVNDALISSVDRAQMATSIIRKKFGESFSYSTTPHFTDVSDDHSAFKYIQKMYEEGITSGYPDGTYRPAENVIRAQMAAFIVRAKFGESFTYSTTPYFIDIPANHGAFKYIQKMYEEGITTGDIDRTYRPCDYITMDHMETCLSKAFD